MKTNALSVRQQTAATNVKTTSALVANLAISFQTTTNATDATTSKTDASNATQVILATNATTSLAIDLIRTTCALVSRNKVLNGTPKERGASAKEEATILNLTKPNSRDTLLQVNAPVVMKYLGPATAAIPVPCFLMARRSL